VLPIRVAGWQPDAEGRQVVYARTDQLIAGLERAVDPDGDGGAHDAARVALVGVAVPFASFGDSPEAQAVAGALALDTLVVVPAGNDGAAGPLFGAVGGPGGGAAALTVGATDERASTPSAHVVMRRGLDVVLDARLPLLGAVVTPARGELRVGVPRGDGQGGVSFFDRRGFSLVAGRAALVPAGPDPGSTALAAARAGAHAVLLYGKALPAGSMGLSSELAVPVVTVPAAAARALLEARRDGHVVAVAVGNIREGDNTRRNRVAAFSSRGLSSGGLVKPDLAAPGVGLPTSDPGTGADREPAFATLNGTSAAAASVAGAAALLAQARPALEARELAGLLTGYARPVSGASPLAVGAGGLDVGAAAAAELVPLTRSLAFGAWQGRRWRSTRTLFVRNVSTRRLVAGIAVVPSGDSDPLRFSVTPRRVAVRPGRTVTVTVTARADRRPTDPAATGVISLSPVGGQTLRVPWAIGFPRAEATLLPAASIDPESFAPSDTRPGVLTVRAGTLLGEGGTIQVQPVERLDVLLYRPDGTFVGLLARLRDVLPGTYAFGITGRGPQGARLAPGGYELRLVAWPTLAGEPSRVRVRFEIA
jgi:subtilisin family serine protease